MQVLCKHEESADHSCYASHAAHAGHQLITRSPDAMPANHKVEITNSDRVHFQATQ